jgi:hypothetical protein
VASIYGWYAYNTPEISQLGVRGARAAASYLLDLEVATAGTSEAPSNGPPVLTAEVPIFICIYVFRSFFIIFRELSRFCF